MKQELARIYRELSAGTLSQQQALQQIRALKQSSRDPALQTLLAAPQWQPAERPLAAAQPAAAQRVLLCGLAGLDAAALSALLPGSRCSHVSATATAQDYAGVALAFFEAVRELLQQRPQGRCRVQLVVADGTQAEVMAGIAGLIETAALENPALGGQVIFVDAALDAAALAPLLHAEHAAPQDRVVRHAQGQRQVRHWQFIDTVENAATPCLFKEHGVYLISGGQGGLGLLLAQQILRQAGAARVVLCGRRDQAGAAVTELEHGGRVSYRQADCADAAQVDALIASILQDFGRLDGIVHSAGILRDDFILKKSPAQFAEVLRPKIDGALHLDRASAALPLDFFLLFSSIAVWAGNVGQADYAAANGFLDEFAGLRQAQVTAGLRQGRSLAIAWPHWIDGGMNIDAVSLAQLEQRTGLRSMATAAGMDALAQCLVLPRSHLMVMHGDAAGMRQALQAERAAVAPAPASAAVAADAGLLAKTREFLRGEFADVLKIPPQRMETRAALEQYGIDSILAMNLTARLEASFGVLAKTLFFEYQSIDELAAYFVRAHAAALARLFGAAPAAAAATSVTPSSATVAPAAASGGRRQRPRFLPAPATAARATAATASLPIAIVGLSGRYPQSRDLAAFWRNLREGRDCIVEVPAERWDWREHYSDDRTRAGAHYSKWGGFIEGVDEFDPRFFNIAPREAAAIDPQERLFLQHAWMAIEDAGYTRATLQLADERGLAGQVGVYAGVMYGEYNLSGSLASIANRVSYFLNVHGPSLTLDTMCSSSLTALHLACQDLRLGRTALALAGGVNVSVHPNKYTMLSAGQFISGDGHCQSFGEGGDGYIPGEGVGVAVLKRLDEAQRDGNVIYGVIRGSALNHGGKTNGYTVPNPQAQAEVIRRALADAGIDPRDVSYIEAHGTGTRLGDPIEIAALTRAFHPASAASPEAGYCRIGSAKSNIGHCESAAGIAGVTKVLLQMKHAAIVPSLHSRTLNPHIDFGATPFVVNQDLRHWDAPQRDGRPLPRIAGISSFGAGGSNAHLLIEEYTAAAATAATHEPQLILLSARTPVQLQQRARDLLDHLERSDTAPDLAALAWTLQTGREAMEERAGFIVASIDALGAPLAALARGDDAAGLLRGQVRQHRDAMARLGDDATFQQQLAGWIAQGALQPLLQHWVQGLDIAWSSLPGRNPPPRRISLPTYPFANERYWNAPVKPLLTASAALLHPLVHANASTLQQPGFRTQFHGREAFLQQGADGRPHLPALLALEALRVAVELAASRSGGSWGLDDVVWGEAIAVSPAAALQLALFARADDVVEVELHSGETVHAQARAHWQADAARASVDLAALRSALYEDVAAASSPALRYFHGNGQALAELHLSAAAVAESLLPLPLLSALQTLLQRFAGQAQSPLSLQQLRVVGRCAEQVVVWLRQGNDGSLDIDIADLHGQVCAQLRGLRCDVAQADSVPAVAVAATAPALSGSSTAVEHASAVGPRGTQAAVAAAPSMAAAVAPLRLSATPREIALTTTVAAHIAAAPPFAPVSAKPNAVKLQPAAAIPGTAATRKARIALAPLAPAPSGAPLRLFDLGEGVFALDLQGALQQGIDALPRALQRLREETSLKVLLLRGRRDDSFSGGRAVCDAAITQGVLSEIAAWPCPVIAVLDRDANGAGLLLAAVCDFIVCSESGHYGFSDAHAGLLPQDAEIRFLHERLGPALAEDLLYRSTRCSGAALRRRGLACRVVPAERVDADSLQLALALAGKPQAALQLLKTHLARGLLPLVQALAASDATVEQGSGDVLQLALGADADLVALDAALETALAQAAAVDALRCIVIAAEPGFLAGGIDAEAVAALLQRVRRSPVPLIAALPPQVSAAAWLFGLACDAVVYAEAGHCSAGELWSEPALAALSTVLCEQRLGAAFGREVSLCVDTYTSLQLRERVATVAVAYDTVAAALLLAARWKAWPRARVSAWKQAQCAQLEAAMAALPAVLVDETAIEAAPPAGTVALPSRVVSVEAQANGVALVTLHDREARNLFSPALVEGLNQAFDHIAATPGYKAVVLSGYDTYFATGGTRETLLAIQHGQTRFTDETVFQRPMDCALPVIAAIQGHAIGGGWSFGMFSDLVLLSRESRYLSPYMGYGFTPGAGSTLMFPARIGHDLARETLLAAQEISGQELAERGVAVPVLPRREVLAAALDLAARIARRPRARLLADKRRWSQRLRDQREDCYRRELDMHALTFVNNAQTLQTIQATFGEDAAAVLAPVAAAASATPANAAPALSSAAVVAAIGSMLAQELLLQAGEIDADTPFIDLGLDSITGVTWIRRINAHYGVDIEATKVYSHPTLNQLAGLVLREAAPRTALPLAAPVAAVAAAAGTMAACTVTATASSADTLAAVTAKIRALLAGELLLQDSEIDECTPFIDLGLDSITGVTWVRKINEHYRIEIEATKVYSHPTLAEIAQLVQREAQAAGSLAKAAVATPLAAANGVKPESWAPVRPGATVQARTPLSSWRTRRSTPPRAAAPAASARPATGAIAVVGMAGQFAQARDIEAFWENLAAGRNGIATVAASRWPLDVYYQPGAAVPGKTNSCWLGALDGHDEFDPLFFNISPTEAEGMEPQQRLFLQTCWHSLENAGYDPQSLSASDCGVFVGCGPSDYHQSAREQQLSAQGFTGAATSILAARIAYFLNLRGPCLSIDTACSSSLVAIATACDNLNNGSCDLALAGGVYVMAGAAMHIMTAQAGMLSTDGRCYSFDQRANGFVPGEGVGVLVLKRLADAQRDNDRIQAVIEAWGVNQDGKTNGITAPNEDAQTRLLQSVYRRFGVDPGGIQLLEAHGTGTKLGDPIEVAGLKAAFKPFTEQRGYCALGSVKSNIGHCLTAAGAAGFIKLVLALQQRQLPPTINYAHCNEHIQLAGSPFYVNDRLQPWTVAAGQRRRGAISSFGFSGTNAHLVVAEYTPAAPSAAISALTQDGRVIVPLSARTPVQLRQQAQNLLDFIHKATTPPDLLQLAYTLQVGREAMGERLAVLAGSVAELAALLGAFLRGEDNVAGLYQGQVRRHREGLQLISQDEEVRATLIELWLGQRKLSRLADLWSKGLALDWTRFYGSTRPSRIALPGYPFARDRYWLVPVPPAAPSRPQPVPAAAASPPPAEPAPLPDELPLHDGVSYAYEWVEQASAPSLPATPRCVLIVRSAQAAFGLDQAIAALHAESGARVVQLLVGDETRRIAADDFLCGRADADGFERCLADVDPIDALYFIAADATAADMATLGHIQASQESNEIQLLRLVKALKHGGRIAARADTWILTVDNHRRDRRGGRCWGAGAAGLAYSLAQGQHQFRVRNLDLSAEELRDSAAAAALGRAILAEPASDRGETIRLEQGRRWRQTFFRLHWDETAPAALKHGGVYVIVGGSGIVGRVVTRQLIAKYAAHVIWLGRSPAAAPAVQGALAEFADAGDKLAYVQADALSEASLRAALAQVKQRHGRIHGAIFSGMVFGGDNAIDQIDETDFRRILQVKTLGSQAFHAALRDEPLDFLCFFSSGQAYAFSGAARLPAYASGITFADSYVRAVREHSAFPVGAINWGFWKAAVRERIAKLDSVSTRSLDALDDAEGFACFERFIAELQRGRLGQVLCMRASPEVEALMHASPDECLVLAAGGDAAVPPLSEAAIPLAQERIAALTAKQAGNGLDGWFAQLLLCQLHGLPRTPPALPLTVQALCEHCGIVEKYTEWLRQSLALLNRAGLADFADGELRRWNAVDAAATWASWREQRQRYLDDADTRALAVLIDECLQQLPAILQGCMLATDVIFPQGSMDKVGALYRANAVADTFNEIVADTVLAYLQQRLQHDPKARLRILEIGAGTGGTSAIVFKRLAPYRSAIAQYCYTDLSKAFFFHAEKYYLADNPYIVCRRLDIEQPIALQGFEPGSYDLVISTNALHATRHIRTTVRHAKSALRRDGLIVVSEMCDSTLATHLTFGLLDGWWLFEDAPLRIPGCPGLLPATWQRVLEQEGFSSVLLPGSQARSLGNQVVAARSDGLIRHALRRPAAASVPAAEPLRPAVAATASVALPAQDLATQVRDSLLQCLSATLKIAADSIETDIAFSDYGIDSILGVSFIDQINARWNLALNTAVIFEYSSIERLGHHLAESYRREIQAGLAPTAMASPLHSVQATVLPAPALPSDGARETPPPRPLPMSTATAPIAVIGMSGKFPKADTVEQFWHNLVSGVDGVDEVPAHYLDQAAAWSPVKQKGKTRCKWAGVLEQRDCFDPLFFSISPKEAEAMNPHQRLVMQESWNALEDAGYDPKSLAGSQTAIFVGAEPAGYVGDSFTGLSDAIIASRLSYALDFKGAAFVVNTGCSSSAVALHLACESLRNGESDLVLAGGVNACLHQDVLVRLDQIEMLSPSGRCFTFDKAGDGTIISEGVGMVVLKRLDQAIADGDAIYGTICASGINQDGASNGITAPNGAAQEQLIVSTYERFGIDPERIGYVEAHGTGTKLGDPVETNALVRAFRRYSARSGWCSVGSAKSHIGHAAAAAGVIGLIKVLLSMQHRCLPALLNFRAMNPLIQFDGSPFHIITRNTEWRSPEGVPRMAAINSFGHSGTNAHLVVSEYLPARERPVSAQAGMPLALPLSAKTPEQLQQKCEQLLAHVEANAAGIDLRAMAYTLQTGREAMEYRIGFAVDSLTALVQTLRAHLDGARPGSHVFAGQARRGAGTHVAAATDTASLLLQRWCQGSSVDWSGLWPAQQRPERQRLPGYPFARERYWIASAFGSPPVAATPPPELAGGQTIEDILDRIADDSIAAEQGVRLLKSIV